jgi:archaellum biogenesis ATPase FlaH
MAAKLITANVRTLPNRIAKTMAEFQDYTGIYICINKTQKSTEQFLQNKGIKTEKVFFIDCVTQDQTREDVLHTKPNTLEIIEGAVSAFIRDLNGKRFIVVDALSQLLIFNEEMKVKKFIEFLCGLGIEKDVTVRVFTPKTQGREYLANISHCFG